jgi:hypothetical protein
MVAQDPQDLEGVFLDEALFCAEEAVERALEVELVHPLLALIAAQGNAGVRGMTIMSVECFCCTLYLDRYMANTYKRE